MYFPKALVTVTLSTLGLLVHSGYATAQSNPPTSVTAGVPGMPPVVDRNNLYSETAAGRLSPTVSGALNRIYVPNRSENTVSVVDPSTMRVVDTFKVGVYPQHIVPSWDLQTLWVANNAEGRTDGSLTPINPVTGKPGPSIPVDDPYNLYWSPDGRYAIVVAEALKRLDFRDPHTMKLEFSIKTPACDGINHADFSIDGRYAIFTCEFGGAITQIDLATRQVMETVQLRADFKQTELTRVKKGMPQDIRISPDGRTLFVADMIADGVHVVDLASFRQTGFIATGVGAHGLYPSRDGKSLYVANRGTNKIRGSAGGKGGVSVIDFATQKVQATWVVPDGGSPDMGNVSADGKYLWLSGRYDNVIYRFDTANGAVEKIKVGREPHGLTVWPQPGRYSLGHTGNMR
nr:YncE family protein [uncultured Albidiferax sp.]